MQGLRGRAAAPCCDDAGDSVQAAVPDGGEQGADRRLALAPDHCVYRAPGLCQHILGDEGHAVPAEEGEAPGNGPLYLSRDVQRLGDVGQVVQRDANRLWAERAKLGGQPAARQHLQVHDADFVAGLAGRARDPLQAKRLKPQEDLRVKQGAGMDEQQAHNDLTVDSDGFPRRFPGHG